MMVLLSEIEARWARMFTDLRQGDDLPPSRRLRTEGLMEALALLDPGSESRIQAAMDVAYQQVFSRSLAEDFGDDWAEFYRFPQIPAVAHRAPVLPTTKD